MSNSPTLSLVILNHNSGRMLDDCLESFFADTLPFSTEVIIVDNASTDASLTGLPPELAARLKIIRNNENRGFAVGNNIGIGAATGRYVCLLNPDTIIHRGAFARLIDFMESTRQAGFCGPRVLNADGTLQLSARRSIPSPMDAIYRALLISKLFPRSTRFSRYNLTFVSPDHDQQVDASTGCCILARRDMLDQIGLLDEKFFIYCEDVDWFVRAKQRNWQVWYVSGAVIEHHHAYSASFRRYKAVADFHDSMIYFYRKHYASRYPFFMNWAIYGLVRARMCGMMGLRTITGWR